MPHRDDTRIQDIDLYKDFAVAVEKGNALDHLRIYDFKTSSWKEIAYPEPVYAVFPGGTPDFDSHTYRYNYQSLVTPSSVFEYDVATAKSTLLKQQEVLGGYDPKQYASERLCRTQLSIKNEPKPAPEGDSYRSKTAWGIEPNGCSRRTSRVEVCRDAYRMSGVAS